jgi:hypothetical protein
VSVLTVIQADDIVSRFFERRGRFAEETEHTSLMVVLLNYGDHLTAVTCVGPERWSGTKADLTPRDGIPHCPNGHPLMESGNRKRLGLVDEVLPRFNPGTGRFA